MKTNYRRTVIGCYFSNVTMSVVGNFAPLLFLTFRDTFGVSHTLLGLLVLVNFCTQLCADLVFSFFSHKINTHLILRLTPFISFVGLVLFAAAPSLFPFAPYVGLLIATVIYSAASGFTEVLISPLIAAIPSDDPDREMSKLHSVYAWGVVGMVAVSTVFFEFVGAENWQWLALIFSVIPLTGAVLFLRAPLPPMAAAKDEERPRGVLFSSALRLAVVGIFLGGAAECGMAQWSSGYLEEALGLPKIYGDLFGVALFSLMLGLGRSLYASKGKRIERVLLIGAIGAAACYITCAITPWPVMGLVACALTGFAASMLWPGSLIAVSDRIPDGGVVMYAVMAAGGDLGAAAAPQLIGAVTDAVAASSLFAPLCDSLSITAEQLGMKVGMLVGALFPLVAIPVFSRIMVNRRRADKEKEKTSALPVE